MNLEKLVIKLENGKKCSNYLHLIIKCCNIIYEYLPPLKLIFPDILCIYKEISGSANYKHHLPGRQIFSKWGRRLSVYLRYIHEHEDELQPPRI